MFLQLVVVEAQNTAKMEKMEVQVEEGQPPHPKLNILDLHCQATFHLGFLEIVADMAQ
jgi:hypothetical protein